MNKLLRKGEKMFHLSRRQTVKYSADDQFHTILVGDDGDRVLIIDDNSWMYSRLNVCLYIELIINYVIYYAQSLSAVL